MKLQVVEYELRLGLLRELDWKAAVRYLQMPGNAHRCLPDRPPTDRVVDDELGRGLPRARVPRRLMSNNGHPTSLKTARSSTCTAGELSPLQPR